MDAVLVRPCDPRATGPFRIGLGLFLVVLYCALLPNWERFYGARGVLAWARSYPDWTDVYRWAGTGVPAVLFGWMSLAFALAFTVGFKTRWVTVALFLLELSRSHHGRFVTNGEDLVLRMLLFYACFVPLGRAWSWDAWRARRSGAEPASFPVWPLRAMQVNFLLIYVLSLPNKLVDDVAWLNGEAVYWSVANSTWGRWPWPSLFYDYGAALSKVATYGTIVVEGLIPWLAWFRRTRRWAIAAGVSLHLGIVVMLQNVAFFSASMMVGWLLFLTAQEAHAIQRAARRWGRALVPKPRRFGDEPVTT